MKTKVIVFAVALFLVTLLVIQFNLGPIDTSLLLGTTKKADTQPPAIVFVDSPVEGTVIGEKITVNINVSGVTNLFGWQAGVTFNPKVLNCIEYHEGEFLSRAVNRSINPASGTLWYGGLRQLRWNNTEGVIYYHGCSILRSDPGVTGSGQLGYIVFEVVGIGVSDLRLTDVILVDSKMEAVPHEVVDISTVSIGEVD
ncbi:MAG TPA: cohesin domain-containing protein [Candidatus Bathyarchaeia archaeon]